MSSPSIRNIRVSTYFFENFKISYKYWPPPPPKPQNADEAPENINLHEYFFESLIIEDLEDLEKGNYYIQIKFGIYEFGIDKNTWGRSHKKIN